MRIAIIGAGAIGGLIGIRLATQGHPVSVLARGATLEAIRARSWTLRSARGDAVVQVPASDDPRDLGPQDLIVIAVKGPALEGVAAHLPGLMHDHTIVLPAMNGVPWWLTLLARGSLGATRLLSVDPQGLIERNIALERVLGCVVHASASQTAPGVIQHIAGDRLVLGEPSGASSKRLDRVAVLLESAGFDVARSPDVAQDIWYKLWGNMTMNPVSALTGATCGRILDDPLLSSFILGVMSEAREIGARIGCEIFETGEERIEVTRRLGDFRTSMLQDVEAGRPLEIDQLLAAPRDLATRAGIETPFLDGLLGLARVFARERGLYAAGHPACQRPAHEEPAASIAIQQHGRGAARAFESVQAPETASTGSP